MSIYKAIKLKEMLNSSNYTLATYLSDMKSKFSPCHFLRSSGLTYPFSSAEFGPLYVHMVEHPSSICSDW